MLEAFRTLIVPDEFVALARQVTECLAPVGGKNMYSTGLSPAGEPPSSHWISSGYIDADYAALLQPGMGATIAAMAPDAGFDATEIDALLSAADISEELPFDAMARLGLLLVQPEVTE